MQVDEETWASVRSAYADASVPLTEIAARFGLTHQRIAARARKEGWPPRDPARKRRGGKGAGPATARPATGETPPDGDAAAGRAPKTGSRLPTRGARKSIVGRLYRAISLKLEHMEKRMASGEIRSAQDEERESRALATLINNFEKVTEAVAELDHDANARAAGADAERMRREIAERLERLGSSGTPRPGSRKPRS